jgi:integrase/recombinase XerD
VSKLSIALEEYLKMRRALGYKLRAQDCQLRKFVEFADGVGARFITADLALKWAMQPVRAQPIWHVRRLSMVRQFARHCSATDPRTIVPPPDLLSYRYRRPAPYIYRDDHITQLLRAASRLRSDTGLRSHTYAILLGLYTVTGMRCNEALQLDRTDVDLVNGVLTIRGTKFGKSRYLPLHLTTKRVLQRYAVRRDCIFPKPLSPSFLLSEQGTRLNQSTVENTFVKLSRQIGLRQCGDSRGPRIHDLRHHFAISTLLRWYRRGVDVEQRLPELSTYLGHTNVTNTYWYLTSTPELLRHALHRVERSGRGSQS